MVQRIKSAITNTSRIANRFVINSFNWIYRVYNRLSLPKKIVKDEVETEDGELVIIYGGLGVGKTTYLCQIGRGYEKDGRRVYTNIPGTPFTDMPNNYWSYRYPRGSCVLLDEVGILHDNRQYKTLPDEVRDWYKYVRHHSIHVFACSQTADIDKKIRVLAMEQDLLKKERFLFFFEFLYCYTIVPEIGYVDKETNRFIPDIIQ